jgi:hypothetical protein
MANGRARALGETTGFVKILSDAKTDEILGVHMIGPLVSELISEGVVAMEFKASSEDLARICHAHPSLSEVTREAAPGRAGPLDQHLNGELPVKNGVRFNFGPPVVTSADACGRN